jgi:methionine synthase II (cobalamin-independent)
LIPKTTTIGSYPVFPRTDDVEYYQKMTKLGVADDLVDPYLWSAEEALKDFVSAGVEVPSTGQTRGDLYSLFLDPKFVRGIEWKGAEAFVTGRVERMSSSIAGDVRHARSLLPPQFKLKEPVTDAYTLARFAKISNDSYPDTKELAEDINRKVVIPEIEDLQQTGAVSWIQLDSPFIAAESSTPHYIEDLYEEVASVAKFPIVLHACGDTTRVFPLLTRLKVGTLSLDFYHYRRLLEEAAGRGYDQLLGLGCNDSQDIRVEGVDEIGRTLQLAKAKLGEDRIEFVHPHCGQRNLPREVAYQKNVQMTLARDDLYGGQIEEASPSPLGPRQRDKVGYFLVLVKRESSEIVVTLYSYSHVPLRRFRSRSAERIFQSLDEEADKLGISRRHLAYLTLELGRAEASLQGPSLGYRQKVID